MQIEHEPRHDALYIWLAVAVIGFLVGAAALALCGSCEARDFTRQGFFVTQPRVL